MLIRRKLDQAKFNIGQTWHKYALGHTFAAAERRTSKYDLSQTQKKLHLKYDFKVRPKLYLFQVRPRSTFFEFDFGHTTIMYDQSRTSKYDLSRTQKSYT